MLPAGMRCHSPSSLTPPPLWLPAPESNLKVCSGHSQQWSSRRLHTCCAIQQQWQWSAVESMSSSKPRRGVGAQAAPTSDVDPNITYNPVVPRYKTPKQIIPPPTFVEKGCFPADDAKAWQNNVILVDKPLDWTSFGICGKLRGALDINKIGHAGTLDPLATGLLIICTGKGTKKVDSFVALEKVYTGVLRLGQTTPSFDAETEPSEEQPWRHVSDDDLREAAAKLTGDILQLPPMFSAIKIKGRKLYEAARAGEDIKRVPRPVVVSEFEMWRDVEGEQDVQFRVRCSKGTYIRSLAHDLGQILGSGAYLRALRREAIGEYSVKDAWSFEELQELGNERRALKRAAAAALSDELAWDG